MKLTDPAGRVQIVDEACHSFGSADNSRNYEIEIDLTNGRRPSSIHGILVDERPTLVIGAAGGASGVHAHSLLVLDDRIFVAVGDHVVAFTPGNQRPDWVLQTDEATCFGVYHDSRHDALISHGELSICRFTEEGLIVWSTGGADVFSEGISLLADHIEAMDFNHRVYQFDYLTGLNKVG